MDGNRNEFSWPRLRLQIFRDLSLLVTLFVISVYLVYFTSQTLSRIFFLALLFAFFFSRRDYIWFAFFFILAQGPGYFFTDYSGLSLQRLPLYTFVAGMSLTPIDLFVFSALVKALIKGRKMRLKLEKPLLALLVYVVFSIFVTSIVYGTSIDVIVWNVRWIFYYSVIISFVYLLNRKQDMFNFALLVFPFVFLILFTQIYFIVTGNEFINIFNPEFRRIAINSVTGALRPVMGGVLIIFFSFVFSLLFLNEENNGLPNVFLYFVLCISFLSVFLSATRLWFVVFSLILAGYVLISRKKFLSVIGIVSMLCVVMSVLLYFGMIPGDFLIASSWGRLHQVFSVFKGDIYAIDTARNRLLNQLPVSLGVIKQNPIIGYGFSYVTMSHYDNDLGFVNTILMFGIIGFALLLFLFARIFRMLVSASKEMPLYDSNVIPLKVLTIAWVAILVGYFTTWDFFSMSFDKVFFVSILIAFSEFFVNRGKRYQRPCEQKVNMVTMEDKIYDTSV